jgi:hypothetical protein
MCVEGVETGRVDIARVEHSRSGITRRHREPPESMKESTWLDQ